MPQIRGAAEEPKGHSTEPSQLPAREMSVFARAKAAFEAHSGAGRSQSLVGRIQAEPGQLPGSAAAQEARRLIAATPAERKEFGELLDSFADRLLDPTVPLRSVGGGSLARMIELDHRIPPGSGDPSIRRILSFFAAPEKITAEALARGQPLDAPDALGAALAITGAAGAEQDASKLDKLADNFIAVRREVLKLPNGPQIAAEIVGTVFARTQEHFDSSKPTQPGALSQRFLMDVVTPKLEREPQ